MRIAGGNQVAGDTLEHGFVQRAHARRDDGHFARQGLEHGYGIGLVVRGEREQVERGEKFRDVVSRAEEVRAIGEVQVTGQLLQLGAS